MQAMTVHATEVNDIAEPGVVEDISLVEAWLLIQLHENDMDFVILDLRSPSHFEVEHLAGAVNLEYLSPLIFEEALDRLDRNKTYLVYCYGGGRSAEVATMMEEKGFGKVYNMKEGLNAWRTAKCPLALRRAA